MDIGPISLTPWQVVWLSVAYLALSAALCRIGIYQMDEDEQDKEDYIIKCVIVSLIWPVLVAMVIIALVVVAVFCLVYNSFQWVFIPTEHRHYANPFAKEEKIEPKIKERRGLIYICPSLIDMDKVKDPRMISRMTDENYDSWITLTSGAFEKLKEQGAIKDEQPT